MDDNLEQKLNKLTQKLKIRINPVITCYKNKSDLVQLKDWFYSDNEMKYKAIQKVKSLKSRGKLPHGVESTSLIISVLLEDEKNSLNTNTLILSYSMALVRFVNGFLDPLQKSNYAVSLHQIAENVEFPEYFVELRHIFTHEMLPDLSICRKSSKKALEWLNENYWQKINGNSVEQKYDSEGREWSYFTKGIYDSESMCIDLVAEKIRKFVNEKKVDDNLKIYKKLRKKNMNINYTLGETSNTNSKLYTNCVRGLLKFNDLTWDKDLSFLRYPKKSIILINILIFKNHLITNNDKSENDIETDISSLYRPLLEHFGFHFMIELFFRISSLIEDFQIKKTNTSCEVSLSNLINSKLAFEKLSSFTEVIQLIEWIIFLIKSILIYKYKNSSINLNFYFNTTENCIVNESCNENKDIIKINSSDCLFSLIYKLIQKLFDFSSDFSEQEKKFKASISKILTTLIDLKNNDKYKNIYNDLNKKSVEILLKKNKISLDLYDKYFLSLPFENFLFNNKGIKNSDENQDANDAKIVKKKKSNLTNSQDKNIFFLFEKNQDWIPMPFGCSF